MELEADPPSTGTRVQPSGSGTEGQDGDAVLEALFVYENTDNLEVGEEDSVAATQRIVPVKNILGGNVSRELFPSGPETPVGIASHATETVQASDSGMGNARQSQSTPASAEIGQTPSASGRRNQSIQAQIPSALACASEESGRYFRNLAKNNLVLSRTRLLAD